MIFRGSSRPEREILQMFGSNSVTSYAMRDPCRAIDGVPPSGPPRPLGQANLLRMQARARAHQNGCRSDHGHPQST